MALRWLSVLAGGGLALVLGLAGAGAASAQVVVLFAQGPSAGAYPQGAVLPVSRVLNLKAGDRIELLDGAGSHVVTGPAVTTAGHLDPKVRDQLIQTFLKAQQSRPGIAATRGFTLETAPQPGLWQLDIGGAGPMCLTKGVTPSLWRADPKGAMTAQIRRAATGLTAGVSWADGAAAADWPAGLPLSDGERYVIVLDDGSSATVVWRAVETPASGVEALASALVEQGCYGQVDRLRAAFASR
jgi:hypothetical protein